MNKKLTSFIFFLVLSVSGSSYGAPISGIAWSVPASTANNVPTLGNTPGPGATEIATFGASAIQFSGLANYSLGGFLNSFGAASGITYLNGASASTDLTNVLFEFTGTASFVNGQTFNVYHDDGVNLYVNGLLVLGAPNITSPITTPYTYNGGTGTYNFDFIYANGPPTEAEFQTTLVTASTITTVTPEPSSALLLATGLASVLAFHRKVS